MASGIRPARESDADFLAWVMQEAARSHLEHGVWDFAFPGPEPRRLDLLARLARTRALHFAHYTRFLVAEVDGTPAAALSAYENAALGGDKLTQGMAEVFVELGWTAEQMLEVGQSTEPYERIAYPNPDGLWIIEWVATRPEYRGRGLVRELLDAILQRGRDEGFTRAQIGYLMGNHPARCAYEGVGFQWMEDHTHPSFTATFGPPGISRMQRDL